MDIQDTKEQAVIISGFTGILCGEFSDFHADVEKRLGRGVQTFEFGFKEFSAEVKRLYEADFIEMGTVSKEEAKAQAVPEGFAIKDVINERQRQINQEFYSTENDDEYEQNELLRAAVCYAENVVRRGWVFDSNFGPDVYQEEEVPDLWPWDLDFWKPKNPRRDLVRAAALIIAEIERIDRSTGASQ